ncbi:Alpha/Beta hydrolase protein [Naematelia encephala]|uniref:Alpha/Beta hydrolase protein n=1 Tax=Naematelia encephala TaxID=71784 RepID=A0A1Y2AVU7_9TREE|nr:Alpha/Beta hydrolase protein [Naematelia encephala]
MPLCSSSVFQLPIPPVLYLIPPSHPIQWVIRLLFLIYSLLVALPLILILAPISVWIHTTSLRVLAPLAIHPDNLPPSRSFLSSARRAIAVYAVGNFVWSVTCIGSAPESTDRISRWLATLCVWIGNRMSKRVGRGGTLVLEEEMLETIPSSACLGILSEPDLDRRPILGFTLRRVLQPKDNPTQAPRPRRAILFLAGGGYVTSWPLVHPFIPSLLAALPPNDTFLLAPNIRKALSKSRALPVPLLDALAGYIWLRQHGWAPNEITLIGDSAGGALCWSVYAYLAIVKEDARKAGRKDELGLPGNLLLISPWLSLPPTPSSDYPDLVDSPQLLNAARCYMARFPILKHRPDPFSSEMSHLITRLSHLTFTLVPILFAPHRYPRSMHTSEVIQDEVLQPTNALLGLDIALEHWLEAFAFISLSSHHPLVSPGTDVDSPFVRQVLNIMKREGTRLMIHVGTAEWFCEPCLRFAKAADDCGVQVEVQVEKGGLHIESCLLLGEMGGSAGRLVEGILDWMGR